MMASGLARRLHDCGHAEIARERGGRHGGVETEGLLLDALSKFQITDEREPMTAGNMYEPPATPAHTHGERPPRVSLARFALWAARRSLRIEVDSAIRRMRRSWHPRQRTLEAA